MSVAAPARLPGVPALDVATELRRHRRLERAGYWANL